MKAKISKEAATEIIKKLESIFPNAALFAKEKENAAGVGSTDSDVKRKLDEFSSSILGEKEEKVNEVVHFTFEDKGEILEVYQEIRASLPTILRCVELLTAELAEHFPENIVEMLMKRAISFYYANIIRYLSE